MKAILLLLCCSQLATTSFSATFTVTNNGDSGAGSLRDLVAAASVGDTIVFDAAVDGMTITLTTGAITIINDIVILGNGISNTIIDGNSVSPLFFLGSSMLFIRDAMLQNALGAASAGCLTGSSGFTGDLEFTGCEITNMSNSTGAEILFLKTNNPNTVLFEDCFIHLNGSGGGNNLMEGQNLTIRNTTITENNTSNTIIPTTGGSLFENCTFTDNVHGGSVINLRNSTMQNNTISGNSGMGVELSTSTNTCYLYNNIIYGQGSSDVYTPSISAIPGPTYFVDKNIVGNPTGPFTPSFYSSANPLLDGAGTLDNGGPTPTQAIMSGSPAIDVGNDGFAPIEDQRYYTRVGVSDIGAFELGGGPSCLETTSSFSETQCFTYTVPSGDETYTASGIYMDTIPNAGGCDSVMTIDVTINTVDAGVTQSGFDLTADATGAAYQWMDCKDSSLISGETNQMYTPGIDGDYACIVTENGCTDTSA
ncbi:right-handed parallel beta-helix repeat-containing protein, partial [Crocinitomix catalasitica]|nr:right-handed parallel beta-helix repeat-containing protein [Crocinitomix catalasitica]